LPPQTFQHDPTYVYAYESRGKAYEAIGELAQAKADFETAKQLGFRQN
jgi:Tfp pilus assembly protein PilF